VGSCAIAWLRRLSHRHATCPPATQLLKSASHFGRFGKIVKARWVPWDHWHFRSEPLIPAHPRSRCP